MNIMHSLIESTKDLLKKYPLAIVFIFISTSCIPFIQDDSISAYAILILLLPIYFSTTLMLQKIKYAHWITISYAIAITFAFYFAERDIYDNYAYWGLLLIHFLLFITYPLTQDNRHFIYYTISRFVQLILSIAIACIICLFVLLIFTSVEYLFNLSILTFNVIPKTILFTTFFFTPILFLIFEQRLANNVPNERFHYVIELVINFIFSPVVIIYTFLVYLYLAKILLHFELPQGGVAYIIMPYIALGLLCHALRLLLTEPKWAWFYRYFSYLSIAPLILLWLGISERITAYGLTEMRVFLVMIASIITVFVICSMHPRWLQYRWFTLLTCTVIFAGMIVTSPYHLTQQNQLVRFERVLTELNLLDQQGKISSKIFEKNFAKKLSREQAEKYKLLDEIIVPYIKTNPQAIAKYGKENLDYLSGFYYNQIIYNNNYQDKYATISFYAYDTNRNYKQAIDIQSYQKLYLINGYSDTKSQDEASEQDKSQLFQRHFALIDEDSGYQYNFSESYFAEVFKSAGLDIHQKYQQEELLPLAEKLTKVPTEEGGLLIFRDIDFKYEEHGEIKGYVYQGGYIEFYLAP
ncbi:DUF4153 domain-containing protein [Pasteurella canis]|uniref:DUF4153 domain-containing protein n=1 Tax=Pasteurella canis TaxID=753 RepID=UPI000D82276B|nr:DUF4153 domain-containing protein [Pasteurella canis]SPY34153.1 transmembrane protein [Pasteurella canis]